MRRLPADWTFADWLRAELVARGWGVRTLARKIVENENVDLDVTRRALTRMIGGRNWPSPPYREAIAKALEMPLDSLPVRTVAKEKAA